ncbi:RING finger [Aspergillus sclerotialis]|uniref:RING-type E3 ubiquitin transferase n=1 Tax=Aspergillus sclerotialis TaxID=2070753 RepID=A0A3A2ZUA7_9EURO|nr:RING finger [Aspergillus sclerotialis]
MSDDGDLQQEVLQRTLQEVVQEDENHIADPCVICLDTIKEPCITVPCNHANFDFLCLVSWLEQRASCPLCKSNVTSVRYELDSLSGQKIYNLPPPTQTPPKPTPQPSIRRPQFRRAPRHYPPRRTPQTTEPNDPILRRRHIYRHQLYSLRVGSNRLSRYRELTPEDFNRDEELVSRARKWIRRELRVFSFLNPESDEDSSSSDRVARPGQQRLESRRANNAEFLLEYVIAILRTVDIKGPAGQAEELLRDFLGRENAKLFLHELQAWLRSPFSSLEDWDRNVQYEDMESRRSAPGGYPRQLEDSDRRPTPVYGSARRPHGRVSKPYSSRSHDSRSRSRDALARARRVQYARDRYIPD